MWGVAVGLAVMLLTVFIVIGFKQEIRGKAIGFGGHIQVMNMETLFGGEQQPVIVDSALMQQLSSLDGVAHVQRFGTQAGMLKTDNNFRGVVLRGVAEEYDTTFLSAHLLRGSLPHFSATKSTMDILISARTASLLGVDVDSHVAAYFFTKSLKARRFRVAGIYQTHLRDFDENIVFTALRTVAQIASWEDKQCSGAELLVDDFDNLQAPADAVVAAVNRHEDANGAVYTSATVQELYPGIFTWLSLLDTNVYVILLLMICISIFTMASGLLIIILERTNFIAVMKSLGASNGQLRIIFLCFAAMLVGRGLLLGNIIGLSLALAQQYLGLVHLDPATYYVDTVPIIISWPLVIAINVATMFISVAVMVIPTYMVSRIHPARVMRFE